MEYRKIQGVVFYTSILQLFDIIVSFITLYINLQKNSEINKINRSKKTLNHKTGSTPFSAIRENLEREGIEASWINTLIRSSGSDNEVIVSLILFHNVHN